MLSYIAEWMHPGSDMTARRALEAYGTSGDLQKRTVAVTSAINGWLAPVAPVVAFPAEWTMPWGFDATLAMPHIAFTLPFDMSDSRRRSTADSRRMGAARGRARQITTRRLFGVLRTALAIACERRPRRGHQQRVAADRSLGERDRAAVWNPDSHL